VSGIAVRETDKFEGSASDDRIWLSADIGGADEGGLVRPEADWQVPRMAEQEAAIATLGLAGFPVHGSSLAAMQATLKAVNQCLWHDRAPNSA
jgi:hypothetical protein